MTLAQMITKLRYFLDDDDSSGTGQNVRWSDAELTSYINENYRYYYNELVSHSYDGILKQASISLVADQDQYALPSDWFKTRVLYRVESDYDIPLEYRRNYDGWVDKTGFGSARYTPNYDHVGDTSGLRKLVLYPKPTFSDATGLKLFYWPVMEELSNDADSPILGFNTQWHDMIPLRAAIWAKGGREEEDVSNLSSMLQSSEKSFYDTITRMSNARAYVEPFDCEGE